jgi:hypothetical protein
MEFRNQLIASLEMHGEDSSTSPPKKRFLSHTVRPMCTTYHVAQSGSTSGPWIVDVFEPTKELYRRRSFFVRRRPDVETKIEGFNFFDPKSFVCSCASFREYGIVCKHIRVTLEKIDYMKRLQTTKLHLRRPHRMNIRSPKDVSPSYDVFISKLVDVNQ